MIAFYAEMKIGLATGVAVLALVVYCTNRADADQLTVQKKPSNDSRRLPLSYPEYKKSPTPSAPAGYGAGAGASTYQLAGNLPLNVFVASELDDVAKSVMAGQYRKALEKLASTQLTHPQAIAESHYIRGVCFQALGNFEQSASEFEAASRLTLDHDLSVKSVFGKKAALAKRKKISEEQLFLANVGQVRDDIRRHF